MKLSTPIPNTAFYEYANAWIEIIKKNESVSIIGLTSQEQPYRINQLITDRQIWKKHGIDLKKTKILQINLTSVMIEDEQDLIDYLSKHLHQHNQSVIIFILNSDVLLTEKSELLSAFNQLPHQYSRCALLFFFQTNIYSSTVKWRLTKFPLIYQNRIYHRLYSPTTVYHFISYLENKFRHNLPKKIKNQIVFYCGGYLWLVKEAVRHYLKTFNVKNLFDHEEMIFRIQTIYDEFSVEEKSVLEKIVCQNYQFTQIEIEALNFLRLIGIIEGLDRPKISVPLLLIQIRQQMSKRNNFNVNQHGELSINTVVIDSFFSRREKQLLKQFLSKRNQVLTRNTVANLLWSNNLDEKYTDWALDQAIKRLRLKLRKLKLKEGLIKTIKNQGFIMIN